MQSNIPNLFVIGAAKSGTTTLYSILARHPQVFMSKPKATRFFSKEKFYAKGLDWYVHTYFDGAEPYPIRGEATPSYLAQAQRVAPRIKETIQGVRPRLIAILRNPVDRAYSHYWYNCNKKLGGEDLPFETALAMEEPILENAEYSHQMRSRTRNYFQNGQYNIFIREYLRHFEREQFLFLLFEDLYMDQFHNTTSRIAEFLNIEDISTGYIKENQSRRVGSRPAVQFIRKQRGLVSLLKSFLPGPVQKSVKNQYLKTISKPVKYPPMNPKTRRQLLEKYRPGIVDLQELIGRDLSHWLNS